MKAMLIIIISILTTTSVTMWIIKPLCILIDKKFNEGFSTFLIVSLTLLSFAVWIWVGVEVMRYLHPNL